MKYACFPGQGVGNRHFFFQKETEQYLRKSLFFFFFFFILFFYFVDLLMWSASEQGCILSTSFFHVGQDLIT